MKTGKPRARRSSSRFRFSAFLFVSPFTPPERPRTPGLTVLFVLTGLWGAGAEDAGGRDGVVDASSTPLGTSEPGGRRGRGESNGRGIGSAVGSDRNRRRGTRW